VSPQKCGVELLLRRLLFPARLTRRDGHEPSGTR
jgi:hypothetical protein